MFRALLLFGLWHLHLVSMENDKLFPKTNDDHFSMQADQLFLATKDNHFIKIKPSEWLESALITRVWQQLQQDYPNSPACLSVPFNQHALNMFIKNEECGTIAATTNSFNIAHFFEMKDKAATQLTSLRKEMIHFIGNFPRKICVELSFIQSFCNRFSYEIPNAIFVNKFMSSPYCSMRCSSEITNALSMNCMFSHDQDYKIVALGETFCIKKKDKEGFSYLQIVNYEDNTSISVICDAPIKAFYQNPDDVNKFFVIDHKRIKQINNLGVLTSIEDFNHPIASLDYDCVAKRWMTVDIYGSVSWLYYESGVWKTILLLKKDDIANERRTIRINLDKNSVVLTSYLDNKQALIEVFDYYNQELRLNTFKTAEYFENLEAVDNINLVDDIISAILSKESNTICIEKIYHLPDQKTITFANKTIQIKKGKHILFELSEVDDICYTAYKDLVLLYDNNLYKFDIESINESLKKITQSISFFEFQLLLFYYNIPLVDQSDLLKEQINTLDPSLVKIFGFFNNCSMEWMKQHSV